MAPTANRLKLGLIGLGQSGAMILDELKSAADIPWVVAAGADPRENARLHFEQEFDAPAFADAATLCRDSDVDAVYIASPSWMHLEHAVAAAEQGKHIICEKPLTLSLDDAVEMIAAADRAGVRLLAGHTHSFDAPIVRMAEIVRSGEFGALRAINAWNFNEFNHRPRLVSELQATHGPVLNQGPHQVDIVRQIGGGRVLSVRATTIPDGVTGVEGGYTCFLELEGRVPATLVYDGRSLFDTAELFDWVGEGGNLRDPSTNHLRRREFEALMALPEDERNRISEEGKESGRYGGATAGRLHNNSVGRERPHQPFFGLVVVSCENGSLRQSPDGLFLYDRDGRQEISVAGARGGRLAELAEMYESLVNDQTPAHDGKWGLATLEVCFAILESAETGGEIPMRYQTSS